MNRTRYERYIREQVENRFGIHRWEDMQNGTVRVVTLVPRQVGDLINFLKGEDITTRREGASVILSGFGLAASRHAALYVTKMQSATGLFMDGRMTQGAWRQLIGAYWRVCMKYGIDDDVAAAVDAMPLRVREEAAALMEA